METKSTGREIQNRDRSVARDDGAASVRLTTAQLQLICAALEDAIAYREPDNNCCTECGEGDALCADHRAAEDRRAEYRQLADELETIAASRRRRGWDPAADEIESYDHSRAKEETVRIRGRSTG
jgi:hypothetical protein